MAVSRLKATIDSRRVMRVVCRTKNANLSDTWISLKDALTYTNRILKREDFAKLVLRNALARGLIPVRAKAIRTEYAVGPTLPLERLCKREPIELQNSTEFAYLTVKPQFLRPEPKGVKLTFNWSGNRIAWVEPPSTQTSYHKVTGIPRKVVGRRHVMYGLELDQSCVERAVRSEAKFILGSKPTTAKPSRKNNSVADWRRILSDLYELAEQGQLLKRWAPERKYGAQKAIENSIRNRMENPPSPSTARAQARKLIDIDQAVCSQQNQPRTDLKN